jgi:hypothetical protein
MHAGIFTEIAQGLLILFAEAGLLRELIWVGDKFVDGERRFGLLRLK